MSVPQQADKQGVKRGVNVQKTGCQTINMAARRHPTRQYDNHPDNGVTGVGESAISKL